MRKGIIAAGVMGFVFVGPAAGTAFADFVCPVIPVSESAKANNHAGFITIAGGDTSILPGRAGVPGESPVDVPTAATNDDGAGAPDGAHATPGDAGYTAIWNT